MMHERAFEALKIYNKQKYVRQLFSIHRFTALCFRHTENVKIMLFECQTPEAFDQMTQLSMFYFSVFLYLINCSIDCLFNSPTYLSCHDVQHWSFLFFSRGRKLLVISFETSTIVSIMMISKIKWHSSEKWWFFSRSKNWNSFWPLDVNWNLYMRP